MSVTSMHDTVWSKAQQPLLQQALERHSPPRSTQMGSALEQDLGRFLGGSYLLPCLFLNGKAGSSHVEPEFSATVG